MNGSIEIIDRNGTRIGFAGTELSVEIVPTIVGALASVIDMQRVSKPTRRPTGRTPVAQWNATRHGDPVQVFLWEDAMTTLDLPNPEDVAGEVVP